VLLRWSISDVRILGVDVYREQTGRRTRLNHALLTASRYLDRAAPPTATRYWLRLVFADGTRRWHGPVTAAPAPG
jgi:hypothetical protein